MSDPVSAAPVPVWRGMKASDTNKTQTDTLDVPCASSWARTQQTLTLSLSYLHSPCVSSDSFIHTHTNSVSIKSQQSASHNWLTVSIINLPYHRSTKQHAQMFRDFFGNQRPAYFSLVSHFKVQIQIFKLPCPKSQGRIEMRGKLNRPLLNVLGF